MSAGVDMNQDSRLPGGGRSAPPCAFHQERSAYAICVGCGIPLCGDCVRKIGIFHLCPRCFAQRAHTFPGGAYPPPPFTIQPGWTPTSPPRPYPPAVDARGFPYGERDPRELRWRQKNWNITEVMLALLVIFVVYSAAGAVVVFAFGRSLLASSLSYVLVFCPLVLVCTAWILRRHGKGLDSLVTSPSSWSRVVLYGAVGAPASLAISYGALFLILLVIYALVGRIPEQLRGQELPSSGPAALALTVIVVVVLAPIFEEVFFRGLLYPTLRNRLGVWAAVLLNGLIFGVLHFQPLYMLSLSLVGAILAYLYEKTESIVAPMLAHGLYNALVVIIALLLGWNLF